VVFAPGAGVLAIDEFTETRGSSAGPSVDADAVALKQNVKAAITLMNMTKPRIRALMSNSCNDCVFTHYSILLKLTFSEKAAVKTKGDALDVMWRHSRLGRSRCQNRKGIATAAGFFFRPQVCHTLHQKMTLRCAPFAGGMNLVNLVNVFCKNGLIGVLHNIGFVVALLQ
jgi:hypothetical protein